MTTLNEMLDAWKDPERKVVWEGLADDGNYYRIYINDNLYTLQRFFSFGLAHDNWEISVDCQDEPLTVLFERLLK